MPIGTLQEKFTYALGEIYDAEHRYLEGQQQMLQQAHAQPLKTLLQQHITQTQQQIGNLEQVYQTLGQQPRRVECRGAAGLVADGQTMMQEAANNPAILDTVIADAQAKIEHSEIACYRALVTGAQQMGQQPIVQLLQQNLQQEEQTAQRVEQSIPQLLQEAMAGAAV